MSYLRVSAATLICDFYDTLRRLLKEEYSSTPRRCEAMVFSVSTQFSDYGYEKDGDTEHGYGSNDIRDNVHIILCGDVHVWAYAGDESNPSRVPLHEWDNISNHDSCWRDAIDSFLTRLHFKGCHDVQKHLPEKLRKPPKDVHVHHVLGSFLGKNMFGFLDVEFERSDADMYRFKLTDVKPSKKKLTLG